MPPQIIRVAERIDAMSLRERALVLVAVFVVLFVLWSSLLMDPLRARQHNDTVALDTAQKHIQTLNASIKTLLSKSDRNPDQQLRADIAVLRQQEQALDAQLARVTSGLIAPADMAHALEAVLASQGSLNIVHVRNLPPRPLLPAAADAADRGSVYVHGLELQFDGSFADTMAYLEALQKLRWHFYWDRLDLNVRHYPNSRITLVVHTLSLQKGWIGG